VSGETDLERYVKAIAAMFEPVSSLAEESGSDGEAGWVPPYGTLFDPATCPKDAMEYLANYLGTALPAGGTEAEWRAVLLAKSGEARGTLGSLEALLRKALGSVPFYILERTTPSLTAGSAWELAILIPAGHVGEAVYKEINLTIPAGIMYAVIERLDTWYAVKAGKKWSEVKAGLKWSESVEGEP